MTFFWVIVAGATVGLAFDFYRSFRRWQGWGQILTILGDVLFSLVALCILFHFFKRANALAFRFYIIWGSLLGLILYLKLVSRFSVRIFFGFYRVITYFAELIHRGIMIPIKALVFIMRPPYAMLRWFSLLVYRIGEFILLEPIVHIKRRFKELLNHLLPPKING
ncbi:spore cortex biosynthesis protein YabQ [Desulfosporosinus sp. Sb-LF]|uniref:spore cortex biosynthesis protein YabQ n=1 Tax=Desulfosporosinus sp. Sb-LF TaxID=2560027 RepID=UPI00107F8541|nr:spore cortex biosynthesis protein YabQ [Desulfosporosinus sp. Sb-LF]TGE34084.1 spore cortex biosynthesis protein YabQ [Desulfosporosinus sp. Sb-LF]